MATTDIFSAVDQTLRLPELLGAVLGFQINAATLASCMRVNSLWAEEAAEILWHKCGYQMRAIGDVRAPEIRHLAALSQKPDRLQWYANYIHCLGFHIQDFYSDDKPLPDDESRDEARYHSFFIDIAFLRLEIVEFWGSSGCYIYNKTLLLLQYLQPGLKVFSGFGYPGKSGAILSNHFFFSMKNRCRSLERLELMLDTEHSSKDEIVSREGFAQFLKDMGSLSTLSIRWGFDNVMTSEGFQHLAQYQFLTHLDLPNIPEQWIRYLDPATFSHEGPFPSIATFSAGLSDSGLELLLPHLRKIINLRVRPFGQFINAFSIVAGAQLTALESLSLDFFPDSIVQGTDLILLAKTARRLEDLYIPNPKYPDESNKNFPSAICVTDAVIDELARHLPKLEKLYFMTEGASLTEACLLSLGKHCKHLESCYISADIFSEDLVRRAGPNLFPVLDELSLIQPASDRRQYTDISGTVGYLLQAFPKLESLDQGSTGLGDLDEDFNTVAHNAIFNRNDEFRGLVDSPPGEFTGSEEELL